MATFWPAIACAANLRQIDAEKEPANGAYEWYFVVGFGDLKSDFTGAFLQLVFFFLFVIVRNWWYMYICIWQEKQTKNKAQEINLWSDPCRYILI